jgi:glycosyltransferase involved in cell wall biosynthesis
MFVSVIISTYNAPAWLEKVVWGYSVQSYRDFELVVADDGSTQETALAIARLRRQTGLEIRHVWHEDLGFRKCEILNRATEAAAGEYLLFTDGDCIPRWDFVDQHVALAEPGYLLSGGCVRLPMALSRQITVDDVVQGRATDPRWLVKHRLGWNKRLRMLTCGPWLSRVLDAVTTTRPTWNGCNSSTFKEHILAVNGHDERMEYGGLDRELGERLVNFGLRAKQVRHRAVCVHLDHSRSYARADILVRNRAIRRETRRTRSVWTPHGIQQESRSNIGPAVRRAA